jgi:hypothetical protein
MGYWITTFGLIAFGFLAMLSIGRPFLLVGLALLLLRPLRNHPAAFWPPLAAVIGWNVAFMAIAPISCVATQRVGVGSSGESTTVCTSLTGFLYSGRGIYNPPMEPANQAACLISAFSLVVVLAAVLALQRSRRPPQ